MRDCFPVVINSKSISLKRSMTEGEQESTMSVTINGEYQDYFTAKSSGEIVRNVWTMRNDTTDDAYVVVANNYKL